MQSHTLPGSIEIATGDGNCAFNAFALALCDRNVLDKVELADNNAFVVTASGIFGVRPASWSELKTAMLATDRNRLQTRLATLLRQIAIETISHEAAAKQIHLQMTLSALAVEFTNFSEHKRLSSELNYVNVGDIFFRHAFIKTKFNELYASTESADAVNNSLTQWWQEQGHERFLNEMTNHRVYAGDLELAPLGKYFGVNIKVRSENRGIQDTQICHSNGNIPPSLEIIPNLNRLLNNRNIINLDGSWQKLTRAELTARLDAVPQYNAVRDIIETAPRRGDLVPAQLAAETLDQLQVRGIVDKTKTVFAISVNPVEAMQRIEEIAPKVQVIREWDCTYKDAPTIYLQNEHAGHWNAIHSTAAPTASTAVKAAPYQAQEGEKDVNDAINKIYDQLNANRSSMSDDEVKENFEEAFDKLNAVFNEFSAKRINVGFFKREKEIVVSSIEQKISVSRIKP